MFRFAARTILELGSELISSDVIAFYELIKNGFDADTKNGVVIKFTIVLNQTRYKQLLREIDRLRALLEEDPDKDLNEEDLVSDVHELLQSKLDETASEKQQKKFLAPILKAESLAAVKAALMEAQAQHNSIRIVDTGDGMSLDTLKSVFLTIGTPSRSDAVAHAVHAKAEEAPYLGEKGLGRLSAMRLGHRLDVRTSEAGEDCYNVLEINWNDFAAPGAQVEDIDIRPTHGRLKEDADASGTRIRIRELVSSWTKGRVEEMVRYDFARLTDPFDKSRRPKITVHYNGKQVVIPRLDKRLLEAAHATVRARYFLEDGEPALVCDYEARDLGFGNPVETDQVIVRGTDLETALNSEPHIDPDALVSVGPFEMDGYWYNRQRISSIDGLGKRHIIRDLQRKWSGIMLFRDRFRVFPYGDEKDDWLGLDRIALGQSGYLLNKAQFVGRVQIGRIQNPELLDQTNREGLRETEEQRVFIAALQFAVQSGLRRFLKSVQAKYKDAPLRKLDAPNRLKDLRKRSRTALKDLRAVVPRGDRDRLQRIDELLQEYTQLIEDAQSRIKGAEAETRQVLDLAGVGLMVEVLAHELARASENALTAIGHLDVDDLPREYATHIETLEVEMGSLRKRLSVIDPLSVSGRQYPSNTDLVQLVRLVLDGHAQQFARRDILSTFDPPFPSVRRKIVSAYFVQVLENLIANSLYWIEQKAKNQNFEKRIIIELSNDPLTLRYTDTGPGIHPANADKIFERFFSLKDLKTRRGLGLFIARDAARAIGATLSLDIDDTGDDGRLRSFVLSWDA